MSTASSTSSVSVIVPCYNAEATLARTLDSCIAQPEAAQIIVVDDGSTDASLDLAHAYARRDARILVLTMPANGGAARARNWAALHASEALIAFMDADDDYLHGALAAACAYLSDHPHEASIRLDVEFAGFPAEIVSHPDFARHAAVLSNTVPSGLVIRRPVFVLFGGFPDDAFFRRNGGEDGAFSWALLKAFGNRRLIDGKRVRMHYHHGIHAERYFRIEMGMQPRDEADTDEAFRLSRHFVDTALNAVATVRGLQVLA
ncbi:glycosyltransferase family A protein [Paraburkholderia sp.]|uniref:glycosyltransferase family 2 protein n=1 Tax=Paraburkholderia sp. TaxID=1926495 RepID=UPI0023852D46|nr:glycosyltransferase family A protein [Paraburkholderia sp.]MDE1181199.1 glycosyltransferase family A protein [Paraburkholderia sp.]